MNTLINWLSQIAAILRFGLLSLPQRRGAVAATSSASRGRGRLRRRALDRRGLPAGDGRLRRARRRHRPAQRRRQRDGQRPRPRGHARDRRRPGVARLERGPLASAELFVIINLPKRSTGTDANVPLRGVEGPAARPRRPADRQRSPLRTRAQRTHRRRGRRAGVRRPRRRRHREGGTRAVAGGGHLHSGGQPSPSRRCGPTRRCCRAPTSAASRSSRCACGWRRPGAFPAFKDALTADPRLNVKVQRLSEHYAEQSTMMTQLITTLGVLIAVLMAVGAVFGALNTMYSAVAARTREIATLRALGFGRGAIVLALLLESLSAGAGGAARSGRRWPGRLRQLPRRDDELAELQHGGVRLRGDARRCSCRA
jgi:putative ABC transport system permease protein